MSQTVTTLILITSIFACPFRCFSCQVTCQNNNESGEVASKVCECCQHKNSSSTNESERKAPPKEGDCSCPSCICEGATIQAEMDQLDYSPQFLHWSEALIDANAVSETDLPRSNDYDLCILKSAGARDALIELQIALI